MVTGLRKGVEYNDVQNRFEVESKRCSKEAPDPIGMVTHTTHA
jgi:hypothetical protein